MSKDEKATEEAPKKKSKLMLIVIVAAVVLLGGGGAGAYLMFAGGKKEEPKPEPGKVVVMDAVTLNLADGHFLKLKIALQATLAAAEVPDGSKAVDIAISEFSNRPVAELSSNEAREKAKEELKKKVEKAYEGEIMDIYFTEFVMQ
jgi:flagellar FliL protein